MCSNLLGLGGVFLFCGFLLEKLSEEGYLNVFVIICRLNFVSVGWMLGDEYFVKKGFYELMLVVVWNILFLNFYYYLFYYFSFFWFVGICLIIIWVVNNYIYKNLMNVLSV